MNRTKHMFLLVWLMVFVGGCAPAVQEPPPKPDCKGKDAATPACQTEPPPPPAPKLVEGCDKTSLLEKPEDPSKRGPWPVGVKTVEVPYVLPDGEEDKYKVEIWYPAELQSEAKAKAERYDLRLQLPEKERSKIPDDKNPWQTCDCYRDLPIDAKRGPYPVILFIHGTGGFRTQSLAHMTHWASRGFVVIAADHPGIMLRDVLGLKFRPQQAKDASFLLDSLRNMEKPFAFLKDRIDTKRIGVSGHSAGGNALAKLGGEAGVQVLMPMAASGTDSETPAKSTLILGGLDDQVVPYKRQQDGYETSPQTKRLVGLDKAGHLAFSDLCVVGKSQGGLIKVAIDNGVEIPAAFKSLIQTLATDGCKEGQLDAEKGWEVIHYVSSAAWEETLHCDSKIAGSFSTLQKRFPTIVKEFKEEK